LIFVTYCFNILIINDSFWQALEKKKSATLTGVNGWRFAPVAAFFFKERRRERIKSLYQWAKRTLGAGKGSF
jgi:hypothetical protein